MTDGKEPTQSKTKEEIKPETQTEQLLSPEITEKVDTTKEAAQNPDESVDKRISDITEELKSYGAKMGLGGLEGRVQRGLDPAGLLAVTQTRQKLKKIAEKLGADMSKVDELTAKLHIGAIWEYADELAKAEDPNILIWIIAAEASMDKGDLNPEEFLQDVDRINGVLDNVLSDMENFIDKAKHNLITSSASKFEVLEGIPVSKDDIVFLAAALNGYKTAIQKDEDGLLFVGAQKLDYNTLESKGLKPQVKTDRGRESTFYVDSEGKSIVKVLYPGLAIVFENDLNTAKELARTAI